MNHRRFLVLLVCCGWLFACSDDAVEQIEVKVPSHVTVPAGMVFIPEGEFVYGHREDPRTALGRKVFLKAFLIDRYELSRGEYKKLNAGYRFTPGKEKFPVTHVTFGEAQAYCRSAGKRLPTEREWEKAARGPDGRKWPWGGYQKHPNNGFSGFIPEPVDRRREWISPYGIYGMGHNMWEWTADDWDYNGMPGSEKGKYKVIRGGLYQSHLKIDFSPTWARNFMEPS
ncbi:MAG: SUMF1/EgtB/PvdO family nonheme iron enzyme, partial [Nitrospinaceae bacterium]|nr:formylglycine-generating enzyme family protein [Nitrospinaceae bacterium]NIR54158.1 formylglycine-generating enzyme family protein [Nitrospinaceae bacterium]NIS84572.1 formylglycine-generating enzyme family protein [Nitrospinaceae bacterium]NIT81364.1 formylglycine-generating enzyme family protein [Nitrospinaceae bacterium]NIU43651.1 formylglycine-generating enzyme family protein [Nitrospinaceae bacterium]